MGSGANRSFSRVFLDAHEGYEPSSCHWPALSPSQLALLRALPVWAQAAADEERAANLLLRFANSISDPEIREAMRLQAVEEARHGAVLRAMCAHYGIDVLSESIEVSAVDTRRAYVQFGFDESTDLFFGSGFFELIRRSEVLPAEFLRVFDRILAEETNHVVLFVNWLAHCGSPGPLSIAKRRWASLLGYSHSLLRHARFANSARVTYAPIGVGVGVPRISGGEFLTLCRQAYIRRLSLAPSELLRPKGLPMLAKAVAPVVQLLRR